MIITFILPGSGHLPSGGFKVVYEYSNRLVARGHEVTVVHKPHKGVAAFVGRKLGLKGGYRPDSWFQLNPRVRVRWVPNLGSRWVPNSDIVVATAWQTAEWVSRYPEEKGCKFYLIQGQENVFPNVDPVRVMNTWSLPLRKIAVSKWLMEIVQGLGQSATYIPNGLNFDEFGLDVPLNERNRASVIMLYHMHYHDPNWKASREGLEAIYLVRRQVPDLRAQLFGVRSGPGSLPGWISYQQRPSGASLRKLYNHSAIFVGPSWTEGWGLPGCEAAQCGAALCVTDIGGHREYAIHGQTALLSSPKDPTAMAANILRLIHDDDLRTHLAMQAHEYVQQFAWERAARRLEQEFAQAVKERTIQSHKVEPC